MALHCPACDLSFSHNTSECSGCGGPLEKATFSMPPGRHDLEESSPTEWQHHADFGARLREATPLVYVAWALLALNVTVFVVMTASGVGPLDPDGASLVSWGADFGPFTLDGQWWRILTSVFLHAGLVHLPAT